MRGRVGLLGPGSEDPAAPGTQGEPHLEPRGRVAARRPHAPRRSRRPSCGKPTREDSRARGGAPDPGGRVVCVPRARQGASDAHARTRREREGERVGGPPAEKPDQPLLHVSRRGMAAVHGASARPSESSRGAGSQTGGAPMTLTRTPNDTVGGNPNPRGTSRTGSPVAGAEQSMVCLRYSNVPY